MTSPSDPRTRVLSLLGSRGWYTDHLTRSVACGCTVQAPDRACDLGEALFRVAKSERESEKRRPGT